MLYSCVLTPMRSDNGFIVKSAKLIRFPATIKTVCHKKTFKVITTFGNKEIVYDPSSKVNSRNNIKAIADLLRSRNDLENALVVAEDFIDNACIAKKLYEQSQAYVYRKNVK